MIEIQNPLVVKTVLKIVQKKDKNTFDKLLHSSVDHVRKGFVFFNQKEIDHICSRWVHLKSSDTIKTREDMVLFKAIEDTFDNIDIDAQKFFYLII